MCCALMAHLMTLIEVGATTRRTDANKPSSLNLISFCKGGEP